MDALAVVARLRMTTTTPFHQSRAVDPYRQIEDPDDPRLFLLPFALMAAVIGLLVLILDSAAL